MGVGGVVTIASRARTPVPVASPAPPRADVQGGDGGRGEATPVGAAAAAVLYARRRPGPSLLFLSPRARVQSLGYTKRPIHQKHPQDTYMHAMKSRPASLPRPVIPRRTPSHNIHSLSKIPNHPVLFTSRRYQPPLPPRTPAPYILKLLKSRTSLTMSSAFCSSNFISCAFLRRCATSSVSRIASPIRSSR